MSDGKNIVICDNCGFEYEGDEYPDTVCPNCGDHEDSSFDDEFVFRM